MSNIETLKARVEETAGRLAATQQDRRRKNQSLLETLARLEEKFAAQEQELAFYRERIRPLEAANIQLSQLMQRLLDMVDAGLADAADHDDPVRQATAKAESMLKNDLVPVVGSQGAAEPRYEDVDAETLAAEDAAEALFEDVDPEALAAEVAAEPTNDDVPEPVRVAIAAAASVFEPEAVDVPDEALDGQNAEEKSLEPTASDIRALLERVEAAAHRMAREGGQRDGGTLADTAVAPAPERRSAASAA